MPRLKDINVNYLTITPVNSNDKVLTISGDSTFNSDTSINANLAVTNNLTVGGNTTITGDLTVVGTTSKTTIQSVTTVYQDPILQVGGTTAPETNDGNDRGVSFLYYDTVAEAAKTGFMGYDNDADGFTFLTGATIDSEVAVSGTNASITCGSIDSDSIGNFADTLTCSKGTGTGLVVSSNATVGGTLDVTGIATFTASPILNGGDITNGTTTNANNIFATSTGKTTLGGGAIDMGATATATTIKGTLNVVEAVTLDTTLGVTGITTLTGDLIANGGDITNAVVATANNIFATSTGKTTLGGGAIDMGATATATTIKGTLNVNEAVTLDTTLDVTGVSTLTGSLKANAALNWFGCKKFHSFAGTLASIGDGSTAFADNDVLVELGTLDTSVPSGHVAATKFFIDKVVIGITTAASTALSANINLSATSGTPPNTAISTGTEIVGAEVASFNPRISATDDVNEIDIDMNATAGLFHVFTPNITADVASKYLYLCATTALNADATAGRFTVMMEYTLY